MVHGLSLIDMVNYICGARQCRVHFGTGTDRYDRLQVATLLGCDDGADVVRSRFVHQRGAGSNRVFRRCRRWEHAVLNFDELRRSLGLQAARSDNRNHGLANVSNLALRKCRDVSHRTPVRSDSKVGRAKGPDDSGHLIGRGRIDRLNSCVWIPAPRNGRIHHLGQFDISDVLRGTGCLTLCIHPRPGPTS